jgi:Cytidylyltransferase
LWKWYGNHNNIIVHSLGFGYCKNISGKYKLGSKYMVSKIITIVPARGGSKGILRKNVKLLAEKPLISYTIEESLKS